MGKPLLPICLLLPICFFQQQHFQGQVGGNQLKAEFIKLNYYVALAALSQRQYMGTDKLLNGIA
jgi:hypothetical protein